MRNETKALQLMGKRLGETLVMLLFGASLILGIVFGITYWPKTTISLFILIGLFVWFLFVLGEVQDAERKAKRVEE